MVYYKQIDKIIKISGKERRNQKLGTEIFSYDKQVSKFVFQLQNEAEINLTGAKVRAVLNYIDSNGQQGMIEDDGGVESVAENEIYYIVSPKLKGYVGTVSMGVYVQLASGESLDIQNLTFKMSKSLIDSSGEVAAEIYFKDFEEMKAEVQAKADKEKAAIDAESDRISNYADQIIREYDGKFTQSNQKMSELEQKQTTLSSQLDETNKKIDEADVYRKSETFNQQESSANVIDQIGGAESAILKKEMLVDGTEGTASRYVKDLPYKENLLTGTSDEWKEYTFGGWNMVTDSKTIHIANTSLSVGDTITMTSDIDASKSTSNANFRVYFHDSANNTITYNSSSVILKGTKGTSTLTVKIPEKTAYLIVYKLANSESNAGLTASIKCQKLIKGTLSQMDAWCPAPEDVGVVHGQPNLASDSNTFTGNQWIAHFGSTVNVTTSQQISEFGITDASRITSVGGTDILKYYRNLLPQGAYQGKNLSLSIYIKNNGTSDITISGNGFSGSAKIFSGETKRLIFGGTGNAGFPQIQFRTANAPDNMDVTVARYKLIEGLPTVMDDWTPSQADSGLTIKNGGMVPFTADEYATLLSADGIVRSETTIVGRGAEIQFDFDVIGTLEKKYPYLFDGLSSMNEKVNKLRSVVKSSNLSGTFRGGGLLSTTLAPVNYSRMCYRKTSNDAIGTYNFTNAFQNRTVSVNLGRIDSTGHMFFGIAAKNNLNSDVGSVSDGVTPAWIEVKDIRLIFELEVNGRTIIESFIANYHKRFEEQLNDLAGRITALESK
ncbi:BppU family phage baseplate upper protein [Enterococcus sp. DIV0800]|uniref:BppU family phage baseplate upper protein n=1 Tax=unclassified Enterococcus TaxID=2608891 RepID=UPI003D2FCC8C